ncbi:recombinase family protein [Escherichia coli]|uniref:recombinase family protein n=1 Tax=Enterobacter sp. TaxID=42895 RepID=UPI00296F780C|nr:recombinase family protein [Enterobacter sp.]
MKYKKSIGYCRVSSDRQIDGYGMTRQQKLLLRYVQNYQDEKKLGYQLSEDLFTWMLQPGQSAFKGYNLTEGVLAEFIKEAQAGKHTGTCLIIENVDRFSRATPAKSALNFLTVINAGVDIHEVETGSIFTDTLNLEELSSSITRANRESVRKQNLSNANWENRFEEALEGKAVLTKRVPKWIEVIDNKYSLKSESSIIQYIFERFCEGIGSTTIARELNDKKMFIGDAFWYPQNVSRILSDKRVCGWLISTNKGRADARLYPQLISDEQFARVQNIKASLIPLVKYKPTKSMNNLFNGISTCGMCKSAVGVIRQIYKGKTAYHRLYCSKRKEIKECTALSIRYDFIEKVIYNHVLNFDWKTFLAKSDNTDVITSLTDELVQKNNYAAELRKLIESSSMPDLMFLKTLDKINHEVLEIQAKLAAVQAEPKTFDVSGFDITEPEDRTRYNLALRKVVSAINITRHPLHDGLTTIEFIYHVSKIRHVILMESMTGDVLSNIACIEVDGNYTFLTSTMNIYYDSTTKLVEVEGVMIQEKLALMINFMESQYLDENIISQLRDKL